MSKPARLEDIAAGLDPSFEGVVIPGKPDLFIPEAVLKEIDKMGDEMRVEEAAARAAGKVECANLDCGEWFLPRVGSGGRPQKYCSAACRATDNRRPNVPNVTNVTANFPNIGTNIPTLAANVPNVGKVETEDFDWAHDDAIVLREQPATAIYFNKHDELVIRQKAAWDQDGDVFVYVSPDNIAAFIDKLTDLCGVPSVGRRG